MGIRVLIVDKSSATRTSMREILQNCPLISIVDTAPDAYVARNKMLQNKPDVICLDIDIPSIDGITFLKKIMKYMPIPVIMLSSLTTTGAKTTLDALDAGAVDFITKSQSNISDNTWETKHELIQKVKMAVKTKPPKPINPIITKTYSTLTYHNSQLSPQKLIAIGSSTGGTEALKEILTKLPKNSPSVIIVQHMPASFIKQFADRLDKLCKVEVKEAKNGDVLKMGQVFIAPGDKHMVLRRSGKKYYLQTGDGKKISGHKPSINVLFNSVSKVAGKNAIGVILTGMGEDGARGLLKLKETGATTLGQNQQSCVVYGMPKAAFLLGAVSKEVHLSNMAKVILNELEKLSI
ncbi:protein-glutamate methylesterase/protein-glutamine glutaminase [Sulfurospirillum arcachonense]|uniref:protein-glutamate methylesterase/protein-glutamine glutaminase n=1 Tax=Sulfurospirillum arcachonense TaxID=57666 RepID=UPI000468EA31|nr:chemotaxis response regulator protein-glutamate methylesterase [Sulfurospirillum arcachonense]